MDEKFFNLTDGELLTLIGDIKNEIISNLGIKIFPINENITLTLENNNTMVYVDDMLFI